MDQKPFDWYPLCTSIAWIKVIELQLIFLTEGKNTSIDDIGEKEQQGNPDGWLGPEVSHDWEAPHQAD